MNKFRQRQVWFGTVALLIGLLSVSAEAASESGSATVRNATTATAKITDSILDKYVSFLGPDSSPEIQKLNKYNLKNWTPDEILAIRRELLHLYASAPGLFEIAAPDGPLVLLRTTRFFDQRGSDIRAGTTAVTNERTGEMVFADKLFSEVVYTWPERVVKVNPKLLAHELAHAADGGGRISCSKEWVSFAEPVISHVQDQLKEFDPKNRGALSHDVIKGVWPSYYGCTNLKEAFAEYVAYYVTKQNFPFHPTFIEKFLPRVLTPSKSDKLFALHYRRGGMYVRSKNYDMAIREFELANKCNVSAPMVHTSLTFCHFSKKDFPNALKESGIALASFELAGVPSSNASVLATMKARADLMGRAGQYQEAKNLLESVLAQNPDDGDAKTKVAYCSYKLKIASKTLQDPFTPGSGVPLNYGAAADYSNNQKNMIIRAVEMYQQGESIADLNSGQKSFYDLADTVWYGLN